MRKRTPSARSRSESAQQRVEPVEQHNDLFGSTVQLASRLCAHAQPEQILVSNAIAELCLGKGLLFEDLGEVTLKGFSSPVRAHAAAWKQ